MDWGKLAFWGQGSSGRSLQGTAGREGKREGEKQEAGSGELGMAKVPYLSFMREGRTGSEFWQILEISVGALYAKWGVPLLAQEHSWMAASSPSLVQSRVRARKDFPFTHLCVVGGAGPVSVCPPCCPS